MKREPAFYPDGEAGGAHPSGGQQSESDINDRLAAAEAQAATAVTRYRDLVAGSPGLVAEMVRGNTVEEIDASAQTARQAYAAVSRQIAQQHEQAVPPGNPARSASSAGAESLKPVAKIALGLRGR